MKDNNNHIDDELLVKYLLGEANSREQAEVQEWIQLNSSNRKYFEHFELIWKQSKKLEAQSTVNVDDAWERFKLKTQEQKPVNKTIEIPQPQRNGWMRAAAALVLLAGVAGMLYYFVANREPEIIALRSGNNTLTQTLPDGSVVTLNKASVLSYPEGFDGNIRSVSLEGEAFFKVAPDKSKPFTVKVDEVQVTVVGTSFNIKNSEKKTEVIVETGIVEVAKKQFEVQLTPHEKATVLKDQDAPIKQQSEDELYNYYRTNEFVCNHTPLWRMADVLSEAYGVHFDLSPRVKNMPLTGTYSRDSLDSILAVISETLKIEIEKNGNNIILK